MPAQEQGRRARNDPERLSERILEAFSRRAKREGIRAVGMAELARELRVSATTLYKHYPSKEALTLACVERWALEVAQSGAANAAKSDPAAGRDPFDSFMHWVDAWVDANATLSPAFIADLRSEYPDAWERYSRVIRDRQRHGAQLLRPWLKSGIDERVAFSILKLLLEQAMDPRFADRLRISRHEAMRSAIAIWAGGALQRAGTLRAIDDARPGKTTAKKKTTSKPRKPARKT